MLDKITPLAAPPGHSLTGTPGRWPWERPPQLVNPDDAIDFIISKFETGGGEEDLAKMMLAGITVEEIVSQIAFKGFMAGTFTPDVAELIKPALAVYLVGLADDAGFEPVLFNKEPELQREQMEDATFFQIMRQRNPQLYRDMVEEINREQRMSQTAPREQAEEQEPSESFLSVEGE